MNNVSAASVKCHEHAMPCCYYKCEKIVCCECGTNCIFGWNWNNVMYFYCDRECEKAQDKYLDSIYPEVTELTIGGFSDDEYSD